MLKVPAAALVASTVLTRMAATCTTPLHTRSSSAVAQPSVQLRRLCHPVGRPLSMLSTSSTQFVMMPRQSREVMFSLKWQSWCRESRVRKSRDSGEFKVRGRAETLQQQRRAAGRRYVAERRDTEESNAEPESARWQGGADQIQ